MGTRRQMGRRHRRRNLLNRVSVCRLPRLSTRLRIERKINQRYQIRSPWVHPLRVRLNRLLLTEYRSTVPRRASRLKVQLQFARVRRNYYCQLSKPNSRLIYRQYSTGQQMTGPGRKTSTGAEICAETLLKQFSRVLTRRPRRLWLTIRFVRHTFRTTARRVHKVWQTYYRRLPVRHRRGLRVRVEFDVRQPHNGLRLKRRRRV